MFVYYRHTGKIVQCEQLFDFCDIYLCKIMHFVHYGINKTYRLTTPAVSLRNEGGKGLTDLPVKNS